MFYILSVLTMGFGLLDSCSLILNDISRNFTVSRKFGDCIVGSEVVIEPIVPYYSFVNFQLLGTELFS